MITYPTTLPKPLQDNFSLNYKPNVIKADDGTGYREQRLLTHNNYCTLNCTIRLTSQTEYIAWLEFIDDLNGGNDWFLLSFFGKDYYCRIQEGKWSESLIYRAESDNIGKDIKLVLDCKYKGVTE